jgi:hypothetical protein
MHSNQSSRHAIVKADTGLFDENAESVSHGLQLKLSQFLGHFATCILVHIHSENKALI